MILDIQLCDKAATVETILIMKNVLSIIRFSVPTILVVASLIQIIKTITSEDADINKLVASLVKKMLLAALVFLLPIIVDYAMSVAEGIRLTKDDCWSTASRELVKSLQEKEEAERKAKDNDRKSKILSSLNNMVSNGGIASSNNSNSDGSNHAESFDIETKFVVLAHINNYDKLSSHTIKIKNSNGKKMSASDFTFKSKNPGIAKVTKEGVIKAKFGGTTSITVTSKADKTQSLNVEVTVVHSLYTKVKTTKQVTATNLKTGEMTTLSAGTQGVYNGLAESGKLYRHYIAGNTLKVGSDYYDVDVSDVAHYGYHINKQLSQSTVEEFVNSHDFSSKTNYLFWSNQGTQYEYIFKGSKGNWKLDRVYPISTGDALGYSIREGNTHGAGGTGLYPDMYTMGTIIATEWGDVYFPDGYIPKNDCCSGYHANGGTRKPKTHGCTAFKREDLKWFINNISKIGKSQIVTI